MRIKTSKAKLIYLCFLGLGVIVFGYIGLVGDFTSLQPASPRADAVISLLNGGYVEQGPSYPDIVYKVFGVITIAIGAAFAFNCFLALFGYLEINEEGFIKRYSFVHCQE